MATPYNKSLKPFQISTFKSIPDFDDRYYVSSTGIVINREGDRIKTYTDRMGYPSVMLRKSGTRKTYKILIHRLLYSLFIGKIEKGMVVDHIDRDPCNNNLSNLRVGSQGQNLMNRSKFLRLNKTPSSKYKGVRKQGNLFYARCGKGQRQYSLAFPCEITAALAYNVLAQKLHGPSAYTNTLIEEHRGN